jgi:site-specific recombinase XerD
MSGDASAKERTMVMPAYVDECLARMQAWMELRGLRPNTLATYRRCAQRFMLGVGKPPGTIKRQDFEHYLLDLARAGRSARTRNVNLAAIRSVLLANANQDTT